MASKEAEVITDIAAMRNWSRSSKYQQQSPAPKTLALVPTMGFLHSGHLSLVQRARSLADLVAVSIYVNPGQFSPTEDLSTYPSDLAGDLRKLADAGGVDAVFCPRNLYDYGGGGVNARRGDGGGEEQGAVSCVEGEHETWIRVEGLEKGLCGRSRPVFFRGVATVVAKLFNIVEPDFALFGKKDYQQWRVICRMVRDLNFSVEIIGLEIVREADGLAMSSRNVHLSPEERKKALSINKSLSKAKFAAENGQETCQRMKILIIQSITEAGGRIDYAEIVEQETLKPVEVITSPVVICVAAWFGNVRLIDNMEINI